MKSKFAKIIRGSLFFILFSPIFLLIWIVGNNSIEELFLSTLCLKESDVSNEVIENG